MRYYGFLALVGAALITDLLLVGLSLVHPGARLRFVMPAAQAAPRHEPGLAGPAPPQPRATASPSPTGTSASTTTPSPTASPQPTATTTPSPVPTATATPEPPARIVASGSAAFTPGNPAVRANIRLALNHYSGALTHVVVPPGGVFSFNAALGVDPERLPWKDVVAEQPTEPAPSAAPPPDGSVAPATPVPPVVTRVAGGGLCDLASRYVMAARPLLPARAFRFVNHVRSTGIRLQGVPARDSVSIWAVGGGAGERDLTIRNVTPYWLEFVVERENEKITVRAHLWDRIPPLW